MCHPLLLFSCEGWITACECPLGCLVCLSVRIILPSLPRPPQSSFTGPWSFHLLGHVTLQPAGVLQLAGSLQSSGALQSSEVLRTGCLYKSSHLALFPFCFLHQLFTTTLPPHPLLSSLSIFSLGPHLFYPFYLYLLKRFRILN